MRSRQSADALTASGAPPDSRPTRMISPSRNAKSHKEVSPLVVNSARRRCVEARQAANLAQESMDLDRQGVEIVHPGAPEAAVANSKSRRFDDRCANAEAGAGSHHRAGVLGNVRLKQCEHEGRGTFCHDGSPLLVKRRKRHPRRRRRNISPFRAHRRIAAIFRPMDIQFDQCEKPRRTLTRAEARRSSKTPETSG